MNLFPQHYFSQGQQSQRLRDFIEVEDLLQFRHINKILFTVQMNDRVEYFDDQALAHEFT